MKQTGKSKSALIKGTKSRSGSRSKATAVSLCFTLVLTGFVVSNLMDQEHKRQEELKAATAEQELFKAKRKEMLTFFLVAERECTGPYGGSAFVEYDANSLTINGQGEELPGATYEEISCLFDAVQMPKSTRARVEMTRALDGQLSDSWSGRESDWTITSNWSYHPSRGLDIVFSLESEYLK